MQYVSVGFPVYIRLRGDDKTVKKVTVGPYAEYILKRLRNQNRNLVYVWNYHGENEAPKVISIRAYETNLSLKPLKYGNRLLVQACVKFDTTQVSRGDTAQSHNLRCITQSVDVFTKKGERVVEGKPKRVVEFLVFQKRMWYDTPWTIRDQLFEQLEATYKSL